LKSKNQEIAQILFQAPNVACQQNRSNIYVKDIIWAHECLQNMGWQNDDFKKRPFEEINNLNDKCFNNIQSKYSAETLKSSKFALQFAWDPIVRFSKAFNKIIEIFLAAIEISS
jgi:hypothetical protein